MARITKAMLEEDNDRLRSIIYEKNMEIELLNKELVMAKSTGPSLVQTLSVCHERTTESLAHALGDLRRVIERGVKL